MPSPFPGMDPYLEARSLWPDVHHRLITAIGDALAPQVAPRYFVAIGERTYIVEGEGGEVTVIPDASVAAVSAEKPDGRRGGTATLVASAIETVTLPAYERVREAYLEIQEPETHAVVTAIEVLSPWNKAAGEGLGEYEAKRRHVLATWTSLVEIDLLRGGKPMAMEPAPGTNYRILVAPSWERPRARLYAFNLAQGVPEVAVPLREGEEGAVLALGKLLAEVYDRARYDLRLDYRASPPGPVLQAEDAAWMDELLSGSGLRG